MRQVLIMTIEYDDELLSEVDLTDGLNEHIATVAMDKDLESDPETDGYVGLDWRYAR